MAMFSIHSTRSTRGPAAGRLVALLCGSAALSGCAGVMPPTSGKDWLDKHAYMVGAEALEPLDTYMPDATRKLLRTEITNATAANANATDTASPDADKPAGTTGTGATDTGANDATGTDVADTKAPSNGAANASNPAMNLAFAGYDAREAVGTIVMDSQKKCTDFLAELSVTQTSTDAGLDLAQTALSALGAVFTPISTSHALSTASTIAGGWKSAVDSDVYAKYVISNYAQAIQASYFKDMKIYTDALSTTDPTKIVPSLEYAKIHSIHAECTLGAAQHTISATLQSTTAAPGAAGTQSQTIAVTGTMLPGGTISLTATSSSFKTPGQSVTVRGALPAAAPTDAQGAAALIKGVNADPTLKSNQVVAAAGSSDTAITLSWPASITVTWSQPNVVAAGSAGQGTSVGLLGAVTTQMPATTGAVPGHSLQ